MIEIEPVTGHTARGRAEDAFDVVIQARTLNFFLKRSVQRFDRCANRGRLVDARVQRI